MCAQQQHRVIAMESDEKARDTDACAAREQQQRQASQQHQLLLIHSLSYAHSRPVLHHYSTSLRLQNPSSRDS